LGLKGKGASEGKGLPNFVAVEVNRPHGKKGQGEIFREAGKYFDREKEGH